MIWGSGLLRFCREILESTEGSARLFLRPSPRLDFHLEASADRIFHDCSPPSGAEEGAGQGACTLTVEFLPHLALGGLQLNVPLEVTRHLSVVGERRVDGELSFCGF